MLAAHDTSTSTKRHYKWINPRCRAVTTACVRSLTFSRIRMVLTWHFTVASVMPNEFAISLFVIPSTKCRRTSRSLVTYSTLEAQKNALLAIVGRNLDARKWTMKLGVLPQGD